jgi:hypothetical protein
MAPGNELIFELQLLPHNFLSSAGLTVVSVALIFYAGAEQGWFSTRNAMPDLLLCISLVHNVL